MSRAGRILMAMVGLACGSTPAGNADTSSSESSGATSSGTSGGHETGSDSDSTATSTTGSTSATSTSTTSGEDSSTGEPEPHVPTCPDPRGVYLSEALVEPAGYEACTDESWNGAVNSLEAVDCPLEDQAACNLMDPCPQQGCDPGLVCVGNDNEPCECLEPCLTDDDCGPSMACICRAASGDGMGMGGTSIFLKNVCVPAECRTSADCGGMPCGVARDECIRPLGLYCRTEADECTLGEECPGLLCTYSTDETRWVCDNVVVCE